MSKEEEKQKSRFQEILSKMKSREETAKTRFVTVLTVIIIIVCAVAAALFIFSEDLFGISGFGLGIYRSYVRFMDFGVLVVVTLISFPFWYFVFEKIKLFVRGYKLDFSDLPKVQKIEETSKKLKTPFFYEGHPLSITYKKTELAQHQLEFALMLGEHRTADEIEKIYQENVIYKNLYKQYAFIYNELADNLTDDMSIQNIKERLMKGDNIEDVVRELIEQETSHNIQSEKEQSK